MNGEQLKSSILQLAIQGKLVPQDPADEPASILLDKIKQEKQSLVKEKKLNKSNLFDSHIFKGEDGKYYERKGKIIHCIDTDIPFEVPQSWVWCRLPSIASIQLGKTLDKGKAFGSETPYLCSINIYWEGINLINVKRTFFTEIEKGKYRLQKDDMLICEGGDVGRTAIWNDDCEMYYQNALHRVRFYGNILPIFFKYVMELYKCCGIIDEHTKGMTIKHLTNHSLSSLVFPLPPLAEQKRIVAKLEEIMPYVEKYGDLQDNLDILNEKIKDKLKVSILQEAIQGHLVEQRIEEGTAKDILEQIRQEKQRLVKVGKIKKSWNNSVIFLGEDNKYYEQIGKKTLDITKLITLNIPLSWEWIRLGTLFSHCTGKALNSSDKEGIMLPYITTSNLYWNYFVLDNLKKMLFTDNEIDKCTATYGDLLVCEGGDIGRAAIWKENHDICIQNHIHKLRSFVPVCTMFFYYIFFFYKYAGYLDGKGIGIQGLSSKILDQLIIPLPPKSEQERIVKKIDELFQVLNKIG
ncbi:MAG: restriction endonuclease subunit S [Prevotella sp.]|nr:restriction endonuclease subunit S [Prevotella sp.]